MFEESFPTFTADFGSPVIFGSQTTLALLDQPDTNVIHGRAQSTGYTIEYPATDLKGLAFGDVILIGITAGWGFDSTGKRLKFNGKCAASAESAQFKVLGPPDLIDDGAFKRVELERI